MGSNVKRGIIAGLISGVVIGILLQLVAFRTPGGSRVLMMEVVSNMRGPSSFLTGWGFHLFNSIIMGAIFGILAGSRSLSYKDGLKYGALLSFGWWLLGGLFLMPVYMGLSLFSPQTIEPLRPVAMQSLFDHILFGLLFGGVYVALQSKARKAEVAEIRRDESERPRYKAG